MLLKLYKTPIYGIIETLLLETNEQLIQFHTDLINCK